MPIFDEKHVKLCGGTVVYEQVLQPEVVPTSQSGLKWAIKVVFPPHCPDLAPFDQLANKTLQESKFRGVLPQGGRMPIVPVTPGKYGGQFDGWYQITFKSTLKAPEVFDENGRQIDVMQLAHVVYTGQKVDVLAHCYEYDMAGNKGIGGGLDAFGVIISANAPRQNFGTGGVDSSSAFGGGGGQPQGAPAYGQQPQPQYGGHPAPNAAPAYGNPAPAYGAPPQGGQAPAYGQQPQYPGNPAAQPPQYANPAQGQPQNYGNPQPANYGAPPQTPPPAYGQQPQGAPAYGGHPAPNAAPAYGQQPQGAPAYGAPPQGGQAPQYGQHPAQAHNFLPR